MGIALHQGEQVFGKWVSEVCLSVLKYANVVVEIHTSWLFTAIQEDTELGWFKQSILCGAALRPNINC